MSKQAASGTTQHFAIQGMHCGGCVKKVQTALAPFADSVEVSLTPPEVVMHQADTSINALNQALANIGSYTLSAIKPQQMDEANESTASPLAEASAGWLATYRPLLLIIGYIFFTTLAIQLASGSLELHRWMPQFMAGFFLVFSFFKLLDIRGFASSYAMYDLLARRWPTYGLIYPFIELGLGLGYLLNWQPALVNLATLIVMTFSSLGVIRAVFNKQKIRCACLGSVFNLPMSTITIIEDLLMAAMAGWMLL